MANALICQSMMTFLVFFLSGRYCKGCDSNGCRDKTLKALAEKGVLLQSNRLRHSLHEKVHAFCPMGKGLQSGSAEVYTCLPRVPPDNGKLEFRKETEQEHANCVRECLLKVSLVAIVSGSEVIHHMYIHALLHAWYIAVLHMSALLMLYSC